MRSIKRRAVVARAGGLRPLIAILALSAASIVLPTAGAAGAVTAESTDLCVGLQCDVPASGSYVPEAQRSAPAVADLDELRAQETSGFYEMPALVYRGAVQPRTVVYLAKAGELDRMPASVRGLVAVQSFAQAADAKRDTTALVVVDHGIGIAFPADEANAARRAKGRAAQLSWVCPERSFCLFQFENYGGAVWRFDGPSYAGTGWQNLGTNTGSSMVNDRAGDTLLADHALGDGTRYCAQQYSLDTTFSNNPIGNGNTSSVALLGSTPDRC